MERVIRSKQFNLPRMYNVPPQDAIKGEIGRKAPRVPWDKFVREVLAWNPGEHVGLIGPTGQGKTTLMIALLPLHKYVTVFATKPRDSTMDALIRSKGYTKIKRWNDYMDTEQFPKRVLWPDATKLGSKDRQENVFREALEKIYVAGSWTVALDELRWVTDDLHLRSEINQ